jgi:CubicO group peptidase (beta-lactamase class C family)
MTRLVRLPSLFVLLALSLHSGGGASLRAQAVAVAPGVDGVFAQWTVATPGCAAGVAVGGKPVLHKAYGMADLEHDVRNTPDTIFEAGSVSKQFTAAAILLLAQDGKLSLDDPVRKYIPELPDYGPALLIRHMLHHTSGLRDWGEVAAIGGWRRGTRVHTHSHVLDIVSRQRSLNFTPGDQYSYSNTGYNLAAIIVERVTGTSFATFTHDRIFAPLGMMHTSWRDDFTRVVRNRAIAYSMGPDRQFHMEMPFENVHGNGGLLTTVGDLLRWNENFVTPRIGDRAFVREQQRTGTFNDGSPERYALGLGIGEYRGVREVSHSGATAGYRAHLARYPDQHVSIVVLCNAATASPTEYVHKLADMYLGDAVKNVPAPATPSRPARPQPTVHPSSAEIAAFSGTYTSDEAETTLTVVVDAGSLVLKQRPDTTIALHPTVVDTFSAPPLGTVRFLHDSEGRVTEMSVSRDRVFDLRFTRSPR